MAARKATKSRPAPDRWRKILHISQAHLAPGMNLKTWRELLEFHGVGDNWEVVTDETIEAALADIRRYEQLMALNQQRLAAN